MLHLDLNIGPLAQAVTLAQAAAPGPDGLNQILPFIPWIVIGVLFYFLLVRPERTKRAALDAMLQNLKKNDRVVTIGGVFGTVVQATKDSEDITLKIDESTNTRMRVLRSSISRVVTTNSESEKS